MATVVKRNETLRAARLRLGLSVAETARLAGLDRVSVWRLENGRRLPAYGTITALEEALGTRLRFPIKRTQKRVAGAAA